MAHGVLIVGESGSGKSASIESLDPSSTYIINIANKPLPFQGWRSKYTLWSKENPTGNMYYNTKANSIVSCLDYISDKRPEIKTVVVDDFQYVSSFELLERVEEKGYDKWNEIAANIAKVVTLVKDLREDLTVFFTNHMEESEDLEGNKRMKGKTCGKLIDKALTLEGLFSVVLFCKAKKERDKPIRYVFETVNSGDNTVKTPKMMFDSFEIPNEMELVRQAILKYEK